MTILIVCLVLLGIAGLAFLWVRNKIRGGVAWLKLHGLERAAVELRKELEKIQKSNLEPKAGEDPESEIIALLGRVATAHSAAKAAYSHGDYVGVANAADLVILELFNRAEKQARDQAAKESVQRRQALLDELNRQSAADEGTVFRDAALPSDGSGSSAPVLRALPDVKGLPTSSDLPPSPDQNSV